MKLEAKLKFKTIYDSENLVKSLSKDDCKTIAQACLDGYRIDQDSRVKWDKICKEVLKIAKQETEMKTTPYKNSSNVKLPLLTTAALQFSSRAVGEFIKNGRVANNNIVGSDPDGQKAVAAKLTSDHMSYQMLIESPTWEKGFDDSMAALPIYGTIFKKTYYNPFLKLNCSDLCLPEHISVNQSVDSLRTARRITHLIYLSKNDIVSNVRAGYFADIIEDIEKYTNPVYSAYLPREAQSRYDARDEETPRPVIEQHRYLDLDGDGYEEPYIVLVDVGTEKLLRIIRRFDANGIVLDSDGNPLSIEPTHYFTDYHFFPSPDGSFWSMGYGQLLFPINHMANSLSNLIIDTARRNSCPSGVMGKIPGAPQGDMVIEPGVFKVLDLPSTGLDLGKMMMPLPEGQLSPVLFQTLGLMIDQSKEVASVTDMLQGKQEGQNMPATTAVALVQQGLVVYNSIIKRTYRSLKQELENWYRLNALYLDDEVYFTLMNDPRAIKREHYSLSHHVIYPAADPTLSSDAQRLARANAIFQAMGTLSPGGQNAAKALYFEALQIPENQIAALLQPATEPNPEAVKMMAEAQLLQAKAQNEMLSTKLAQFELQLSAQDRAVKQQLADIKAMQVVHSAQKADSQTALNQQKEDNAAYLADAQIMVDALKAVDPEKGKSLKTVKAIIDEETSDEETDEESTDNPDQ